jgi:metal-responsive CopG/Arc/MetJ family transcriptional regulator
MPASTKQTKPPVRSVQIAIPTDLIATIDQIAAHEMLTRSAWMRRVINNAVRYTRWEAELHKPR